MPPLNDNLADAQLITASGTIAGTTVDSTVEPGKETDDSYVNTVWYRIEVSTAGNLTLTFDAGTFVFYAEVYRAVGSGVVTPPSSDPPADFADLVQDYDNFDTYLDGTGPLTRTLTVEAGDVLYMLVMSDSFVEGDTGTFSFAVAMPRVWNCLNAAANIGSSSTASVVSGAVREEQTWDTHNVFPYESLTDLEPTLTFAGADIVGSNGTGFYACKIKTKNNTFGTWDVMVRRNGQTLLTYALGVEDNTGATAVEDLVTMPADGPTLIDSLNMLRWVPVETGDTIDIIVFALNGPGHVDIEEVCFSFVNPAIEGPLYDQLDVPTLPLGMSAGDITTTEVQGDLAIYKTVAPTYNQHAIWGQDMCVTDDGNIWVCAMLLTGSISGTWIGPYLMKWNGSAWSIIRDDMEGYGVKRAQNGPAGSGVGNGPWGISMDTDGTDLWIAYNIDDGAFSGPGGGRNALVRVKKYVPATDTLSNVGSPFAGNTTKVWFASLAGDPEVNTPHLKLSPAGVPWVAFIDIYDSNVVTAYPAYVAKWNGSSWVVTRLPAPDFFEDEGGITTYQAKDVINGGSGTASVTTFSGELSVKDTQTSYAADTLKLTPPAGDWGFVLRLAVEPAGGGYAAKVYKNGVSIGNALSDDLAGTSLTTAWFGGVGDAGSGGQIGFYGSFNGSDELEVRIMRTGTSTAVHIDEVSLIPRKIAGASFPNQFGAWWTRYVDDGQTHCNIAFPGGENPVAVYQAAMVDGESTAEGESFENTDFFQKFVYSKFNGSSWDKMWEHLPEDDVPDHVWHKIGEGHWQQGMGLTARGGKVYLTAALGYLLSFTDMFICVELTDSGMSAISDGPPGVLTGEGVPAAAHAASAWDWGTHHKALASDARGNFWLGWGATLPDNEGWTIIGNRVRNGIGDWFIASDSQLERGYDQFNVSSPTLVLSPDETKLYLLVDIDFVASGTFNSSFGVWEIPILQDQKIPLIPGGGPINMNWRYGDRGAGNIRRVNV